MATTRTRAFSFTDQAEVDLMESCEMLGTGNQSAVVRAALAHFKATKAPEVLTQRVSASISNYADQIRKAAGS